MKPLAKDWTDHTLALIKLRQLSVLFTRAVELVDGCPPKARKGFSEEDARSWKVMELHVRQGAIAASMVRHRHGEDKFGAGKAHPRAQDGFSGEGAAGDTPPGEIGPETQGE